MSTSVKIDLNLARKELEAAMRELDLATRELELFEDECGQKHQVDFAIETSDGLIGVRENEEGESEFILSKQDSQVQQETVNQVKQAYARIKILDQAKRQGYQNVKEEKLSDGSIRVVLEKWR